MGRNVLKMGLEAGAAGDMFVGALFSLLADLPGSIMIDFSINDLKARLDKISETFGDGFSVSYSHFERLSQKSLNITLVNKLESKKSRHVTLNSFAKILKNLEENGLMEVGERLVAEGIIAILAKAEAKAHAVSLEKVHFHEIGEEDSIFDIIAASILISQISKILDNPTFEYEAVEIGFGLIDTSHGQLEIPAPATKNIIDEHNLQFRHNFEGENLTPTGAAILGYLRPVKVDLLKSKQLRTIAKGVGTGSRNPFDRPNILTLELLSYS